MSDGTTVRAIRAIRTHVYVAIPSLILGAVCGTAGWHLYQRHVCGDYSYVNPDLACGEPPVLSKAAYGEFAHDLLRYMENKDAAGIKIGVFFRDLGNGPVFGINEDLEFIPASLMKLPTVITYFDLADELPGLLETELPYTRESIVHFEILQQVEAPAGDLREGRRYSIEQLMRNTIVFSDNLAYYVLLEHLKEVPDGEWRLARTFRGLGVVNPLHIEAEVASVHDYASIFRSLYNVSYLNAGDSEKLLSWLARSTYRKGLVAGVPAGVPVAHKFGERYLADGSKQLHDCGIIYYPRNAYSLCVMTKGPDWQALTDIVATISRRVYAEVDSRRVERLPPASQ